MFRKPPRSIITIHLLEKNSHGAKHSAKEADERKSLIKKE